MAKHLMVDLETLATTPNAQILTLGAVTFNPNGYEVYDELYLRIDVDTCAFADPFIDDNTIRWWADQDKAAQEEAFSPDNRIDCKEAMEKFYKFCMGSSRFWSHGSTFDIIILEHYFRKMGKPFPWNFWDVRDTRTLFDLGMDPEMPQSLKHHALEDARRQAIGVQTMFKKMRRKFEN